MNPLFSKFSVVCCSATVSLLTLSSQAIASPQPSISNPIIPTAKTTKTQPPQAKPVQPPVTSITAPVQTPTATTTPVTLPTTSIPTATTTPATVPTTSSVNTTNPTTPTQTPAVTSPQTPATNKTATATDNKVLATKLILNLKERRVYAYQNDKVLVSYPVAIGKKGWETPTGTFSVIEMIKDPVWENPWNGKIVPSGPNGPIGERWIGFTKDAKTRDTIGFHGTPKSKENLLGQAVSHGCVRMRNADVKALFEIVQVGIPVVVVPK